MWGLSDALSRLITIMLTLLLLLTGVYALVLHWEMSSLQNKLGEAQANYTNCKANTTTLEGSIESQNDALAVIRTAQLQQAAAEVAARASADDMRRLGRVAQDAVARLKLTGKCPADMQTLGNSVK